MSNIKFFDDKTFVDATVIWQKSWLKHIYLGSNTMLKIVSHYNLIANSFVIRCYD